MTAMARRGQAGSGAVGAWFSFDDDERRDSERVSMLEEAARTAAPPEAMQLLAEADELRERWDTPRRRFASIAEIVDALESLAREARELDHENPDAVDDLGYRSLQRRH
jgi:hypothetical protein